MDAVLVLFTKDRETNRKELRMGLAIERPDWVGAVPRHNQLEQLQQLLPAGEEDLFIGSAELYPDGSINVYVRRSQCEPPIGFLRIRHMEAAPWTNG